MRRLVCLIAVLGTTTAAALAATAGWGHAVEVPGTAALNVGGYAEVDSISCATAASCAAGGSYRDGSDHAQPFVANRKNGVWRKATTVPGYAALNPGGDGYVYSVSCATAGACTAAGYYSDGSTNGHAWLVDKKNGVWRKAVEVPGSVALNLGGDAAANSVSCATAGSCSAGGYYRDGSSHLQAFVVSKKNGVWRKATEVPGLAALNLGDQADLTSISCATAGSCAAGGYYRDGSGHIQAFVVSKKNGVWRKAVEVPGSAALNLGGEAELDSISCATAGSCAAGGSYTDGSGHRQVFVVNEKNGRWRKAVEAPGLSDLNLGGNAGLNSNSISCPAAGSCAAGGSYTDGSGHRQAFVMNEKNGVWRKAVEVPGSADLNLAGGASVYSISCATAGSCAAGGSYGDGSGHRQVFVAKKKNGVWRTAVELPGSAALNLGGSAELYSIVCATARSCTAGGYYKDGSDHVQAYVTTP